MKKEPNCTRLYFSNSFQRTFLWIFNASGVIHLRKKLRWMKNLFYNRLAKAARNWYELFAIIAESSRSFGILPDVRLRRIDP